MEDRNGAKVKMQVKEDIITKGRSESYGSIEDMVKRKRIKRKMNPGWKRGRGRRGRSGL